MRIRDRHIARELPVYVIAEIGVNHDGDPDRAVELTEAAADAGANAVKLQHFVTDRLMSRAAKLAAYQRAAGETDPIAMLRRLELPPDDMARVVARAQELDIAAIVTVFSVELVGVAASMGFDAWKSASPDVVNKPLLHAYALSEMPIIVSTGAAELDEVTRAAGWLEPARDRLAMLQCVSSYPAPENALGGIPAIERATGLPVGYSDHTQSIDTGRLAVEAGAVLLERHITHDRGARGPDHAASLEPREFAEYTRRAKEAAFVGSPAPRKTVLECERDVRTVARQSIVATRDLPEGHLLTRDDLTIKRPGTGLGAWRLEEAIGARTSEAIEADTPITEPHIAMRTDA